MNFSHALAQLINIIIPVCIGGFIGGFIAWKFIMFIENRKDKNEL